MMCSSTVLCPVCCSTSFSDIESLRNSLIKVANSPLNCPICSDILQGLDKLTIHLFSHTNTSETKTDSDINCLKFDSISSCESVQAEKSKAINFYNKEIGSLTETYFPLPSTPPPSASQVISPPNSNIIQHHQDQCSTPDLIGENLGLGVRSSSPDPCPLPTTTILAADVNINQQPADHEQCDPKCDICGLTFRSIELSQLHERLLHGFNNQQPNDPMQETTQSRIENVKNVETANNTSIITTILEQKINDTDLPVKFQCHLCAKSFKMKGSLRIHLKVVHLFGVQIDKTDTGKKLGICEKIRKKGIEVGELEDDSVNSPSRSVSVMGGECLKCGESIKSWECNICGKSFTTKYFLNKHKRLHTGEMPYTCEICGRTFTFQQSYHKHILYHSDEKPYICTTCGRAFKELSTLHNHERIHSGEKPFKCENCGKNFRQRVSYLVHRRIHTGVMPYKCTACNKSFRYKVSQKTHKCKAKPPGTVIRQTGDLLKRLFKDQQERNSHNAQATAMQDELIDEQLLAKSIDDIVAESCNKMGIGIGNDDATNIIMHPNPTTSLLDETNLKNLEKIPSPSQQFNNLCIYSPSRDSFVAHLEAYHDEAFNILYNVDDKT